MRRTKCDRPVIQAVLAGTYSIQDLNSFLQLCYSLALPTIRKKIGLGKLNPDIIGLNQDQIVHDCIADLFLRDADGRFPLIQTYFEEQLIGQPDASDELHVVILRRLIFGKVNNAIVRLYSEADPQLAKIIRNLKLALERTQLFEHVQRFGESYLIPRNSEVLFEQPPFDHECLRFRFSEIACIHDTMPALIHKLYRILTEQSEFQRTVPIMVVGLLCKEIYRLGWELDAAEDAIVEQEMSQWELIPVVNRICKGMHRELYESYVDRNKLTRDEYDSILESVNDILVHDFGNGQEPRKTYFEHLQSRLPGLTSNEYHVKFKTIFEYCAKVAKRRLRLELHHE